MSGPGAEGLPPLPAYAEHAEQESVGESGLTASEEMVLRHLQPHIAGLVAAARAEGAARVWAQYARQYEHAEKMPRWDQDKTVIANGWAAGRCGNCGEALPATNATAHRCPSCRPVGGGYCQTCGKPL